MYYGWIVEAMQLKGHGWPTEAAEANNGKKLTAKKMKQEGQQQWRAKQRDNFLARVTGVVIKKLAMYLFKPILAQGFRFILALVWSPPKRLEEGKQDKEPPKRK